MESSVNKNTPPRWRAVAILWALTAACFALFHLGYLAALHMQETRAPERFLDRAEALAEQGAHDAAIATLKVGLSRFAPPVAAPHTALAELLEAAGRADEAAPLRMRAAFYESRAAHPTDPEAAAARVMELRDRLFPDALPLVLTPGGEETLAAVFESFARGVGWDVDAAATLSTEARWALLSAAGGALRDDGWIGGTGVLAPVDLLALSGGGRGVRRAAHLFVDGRDYAQPARGLHAALLDPDEGVVFAWRHFDFWDDVEESHRMDHWLDAAPEGSIGLFAVYDDASANMTAGLQAALTEFGLRPETLRYGRVALYGLRGGFAAIGVKGAPPGTALQAWSPESFMGAPGHPVASGVVRAAPALEDAD